MKMTEGLPRSFLEHALVQNTRGPLCGCLLGAAFRLGGTVFTNAHFDGKGLGVLRTALLDDGVTRLRQLAGLRQLLERALEIGKGRMYIRPLGFIAIEGGIQ